MISITMLLYIVGLFIMCSVASPSDIQYNSPSNITVNEYFNNQNLPPPVSPSGPSSSNFIHQGTNFFFNPQLLFGTHVPPPIGAVITTVKLNVTEPPVVIEEPKFPDIVVPENTEPMVILIPPPPITPIECPELPDPVLVNIPPASVLPPLELPEFPVIVEETIEVLPPRPPEIVIPEVIPVMPDGPILPPLVLPNILPLIIPAESEHEPCPAIEITEGELNPVVLIPPEPEIPEHEFPKDPVVVQCPDHTIPTVCARNIVVQRVLPNILINKKSVTKTLELISIPAAVNLPVLTSPFYSMFKPKNLI